MEYMEALMHDAAKYYLSRQVTDPIVAMISRRQIAIVVHKTTSRGYILDMELFLSTLNSYEAKFVKENFEAWAVQEEQGYLLHVLPNDFRPFFMNDK